MRKELRTCAKTSRCGNSHKNLTILELLESSQITKCNGFCRNHCVLLKISKELSCKFFKVLGQVLRWKAKIIDDFLNRID
ncbi:hypothetical protein B2G50_11675 [Leptospira interrogans serovar Canicola]|nr:hypothetical protein B2G50_11675 [Leptospira interrogans serovar Canicola]